MSCGSLPAVGIGNSVMVFGLAGVIRPTWLPVISTNQRLPSGPDAMPAGLMSAGDTLNSVMVFGADGRMRAMLPESNSVNQRFPSGPAVMPAGPLPGEARNSVKHCPCAEPVGHEQGHGEHRQKCASPIHDSPSLSVKGQQALPGRWSNATFEVAGRYLVETSRLARRRRGELARPARDGSLTRADQGSGPLLEK